MAGALGWPIGMYHRTMPALGAKVVAPFSGRGVYLASVLLGVVWAPGMGEVERWETRLPQTPIIRDHLSPGGAYALTLILIIGAAFVPAMIIGLWLSCLSQRRVQVAVAAGLAGGAELLTGLLVGKLWSPDGGTEWQGWPLPGFLINVVIITVFSAGVALLIRWLVRALL